MCASCGFALTNTWVYYISGSEDLQGTHHMAVHGALAAFNPQEEDWSEYSESLTFYFTAIGITTDAKKRAILLSCCGPAIFRLLRSLVIPSALDDFSFGDLVAKVKKVVWLVKLMQRLMNNID